MPSIMSSAVSDSDRKYQRHAAYPDNLLTKKNSAQKQTKWPFSVFPPNKQGPLGVCVKAEEPWSRCAGDTGCPFQRADCDSPLRLPTPAMEEQPCGHMAQQPSPTCPTAESRECKSRKAARGHGAAPASSKAKDLNKPTVPELRAPCSRAITNNA